MQGYRCPKCGIKTAYRRDYGGLCENCYIELKKELIGTIHLNKIRIKRCKVCGRILQGENWLRLTNRNLSRMLKSIIKRELKRRSYLKELDFEMEIKSPENFHLVIMDKKTGLKIEKIELGISYVEKICPRCILKYSGGFYECLVRVRIPNGLKIDFYSSLKTILRNSKSPFEVIDIKRVGRGDWDLFFANKQDCRNLAHLIASKLNLGVREGSFSRYFKGLNKSISVTEYIVS